MGAARSGESKVVTSVGPAVGDRGGPLAELLLLLLLLLLLPPSTASAALPAASGSASSASSSLLLHVPSRMVPSIVALGRSGGVEERWGVHSTASECASASQ